MLRYASRPGPGGAGVTLAILCGAARSDLDPASASSLSADLVATLRSAGAREVRVLSRLGAGTSAGAGAQLSEDVAAIAAQARSADEGLLLCADDLVTHPSLLWMLATEPAGRTSVLVGDGGVGPAVREERGRIVSTDGASPARFLGALWVAPRDLPLLAAVAERTAHVPRDNAHLPGDTDERDVAAARATAAGGVDVDALAGSAVDVLLPALLGAGLRPMAQRVRLLHAERVTDAESLAGARRTVAAIDEDTVRLRLAVKEHDDVFTTYAVSSWSPWLTRWAARLRLTPTGVTALSVLLTVIAALAFWEAGRPAMLAGAVLLYLGFVLDCVDGQLARFTREFSAFGGWLDTMADRAKEYAVYAGLAAGAERLGLAHAWPLAIAAMVLQTVRHLTDAWYGALHDAAATRGQPVPGTAAPAGTATPGGLGERLGRVSNRVQADTGSLAYWLKRVVVFPIGERWALIAVTAALFNGRVALTAVLVWGVLAATYTLALRSLRSIAMRVPVLTAVDVSLHRDDGQLAREVLGRSGVPGPLPAAFVAVAGAAALTVAAFEGWILPDRAGPAVAATAAVVLLAGLPARARHAGPLDWLVPAALRAAEYLFVVAVGVSAAVPAPLIFALLFALSMRHYDVTARMEKGAPQNGLRHAVAGWDGRVVLLAGAALAGEAAVGVVALTVAILVWSGLRGAAVGRLAVAVGRPRAGTPPT
jgi:Family of unknown function (DUF5941)/CDP-alcohol phosphatidyltransferase